MIAAPANSREMGPRAAASSTIALKASSLSSGTWAPDSAHFASPPAARAATAAPSPALIFSR